MRGSGSPDWNMSSMCLQGNLPRPLGGYQPNIILEPHSAAPAWQPHQVFPKQEPIDEDRSDSGIISGSDFHSSSPGSETSQDYNQTTTYSHSENTQQPKTLTYYSTPLMSKTSSSPSLGLHTNISKHLNYQFATTNPNNNNNNVQVPQPSIQDCVKSEPRTESMQTDNVENEDPLRSLEFALQNTGLLQQPPPSMSPKTSSEHSDDDNDQSIRIPRVNSHGKIKLHRCKQCDFVADTKIDFWKHTKQHIKAEKLLVCCKCPFVTEYKHHLEYHMRNHSGSKPYKCNQCSYTCVNKSMLNSHLKSHSNIYQYRCSDCSYASKYCHSLKLHLRKYKHRPAMVLNPDGTPNPYPIVDVYGTRRGPKQRSSSRTEEPQPSTSHTLQNPLAQYANLLNNSVPQIPLPLPYNFFPGLQNSLPNPLLFPLSFENLSKPSTSPDHKSEEQEQPRSNCSSPDATPKGQDTSQALDLSKPDPKTVTEQKPQKNRRKGRAFKLESLPVSDSSDEEDDFGSHIRSPEKQPQEEVINKINNNNNNNKNNNNDSNTTCQYCNISFGDIVLYTMHMGYHGFKDPFTCNRCGEQCEDKVAFFLHIARNPHT